jgi:uncharacterized membrane protein YraQ (UPF0718 family)
MKKYFKKNWVSLILILAFILFTLISYNQNFYPGKLIYKNNFLVFIKEMLLFLPIMFLLIGLADVWLSKEKVEKNIGKDSGIKGVFFIILLSMVQAGPLYGAFPVTYLLWKKGTSIRNIFIYIGAFSTIKIPLIMFEIGFLGWKFSLIRTMVSLPIIILIAIIMEKYLQNRNFKINKV